MKKFVQVTFISVKNDKFHDFIQSLVTYFWMIIQGNYQSLYALAFVCLQTQEYTKGKTAYYMTYFADKGRCTLNRKTNSLL